MIILWNHRDKSGRGICSARRLNTGEMQRKQACHRNDNKTVPEQRTNHRKACTASKYYDVSVVIDTLFNFLSIGLWEYCVWLLFC